jgi:acyl dehydratase
MTFTEPQVGDELVTAEFGPLTIIDTVRWAGVQENVEQLHFDREFVRENSRLRTFIASGGYRQALLARALTDRIGPRGKLLQLRVRHTAPTFEGDMLRYSARITETTKNREGNAITCEVEGKNQQNEQILVGSCIVLVPGDHDS